MTMMYLRASTVARCVTARYASSLSSALALRRRDFGGVVASAFHSSPSYYSDANDHGSHPAKLNIPQHVQEKIISAEDAVELVQDGNVVAVSGFVCQGAPEAVLKALGERFDQTQSPKDLTLLFGGGPGDYGKRGLSHLAKKSGDTKMLRRTIGGHYGQVPGVAAMALANEVEAWTLPMGSISRMIRAQATHSPGHITNVGIGTYVDPELSGGAVNEAAKASPLHKDLVTKLDIAGQTHLMYKALPINVAIIRGTTADSQGNITLEHESLYCDQKITAMAAKNSGGIVIAQVKRVTANGSIPSRKVDVPGALVDCVVVVDSEYHDTLHPMSYIEKHNPSLTGEIVTPADNLEPMPLDLRKVIARRAFFGLEPNKIINLGIGLPEGVASVASEEGLLKYVTLSTEPGVFGGLPASGHMFGPAYNASALVEMNQMFDFYDGGGLDQTFLGAAEIAPNGDVNVSRMSKDRLTGPGGFIDISQSTRKVTFMSPLTAKGLELDLPGDGTFGIKREGQIKKFVKNIYEKTFSGDEAVRRGQEVKYVTERAVFRRTNKYPVLELIEIAPGIDLQRDVLDQLEFEPVVSPNLKIMDTRIFEKAKMNVANEIFGSLEDRCTYHDTDHTMYLELFGVSLNDEAAVDWFVDGLRAMWTPLVEAKGPMNIVVNYDGFDLREGLEEYYRGKVKHLENELYKTVTRYTGNAFRRAKLKAGLGMSDWDPDELYDEFDADHNGHLSLQELLDGFNSKFQMHLTPAQVKYFMPEPDSEFITRRMFGQGMKEVLKG